MCFRHALQLQLFCLGRGGLRLCLRLLCVEQRLRLRLLGVQQCLCLLLGFGGGLSGGGGADRVPGSVLSSRKLFMNPNFCFFGASQGPVGSLKWAERRGVWEETKANMRECPDNPNQKTQNHVNQCISHPA